MNTKKSLFGVCLALLLLYQLPNAVHSARKKGPQDDLSFSMVGRKLHPDVALSYFDSEGHSPFKGECRSKILRLDERVKEGDKIKRLSTFRFTFDVDPAGWDKYLGWYFSMKQGTIDFTDKTVLKFEMKGTKDIPTRYFQIGVRSINVNPEINNAKFFLEELGYDTFPTEYTTIEVPVSFLLEREPNLDMAKMNDLIVFGFVGPDEKIVDQKVWLRNISWDWALTKTDKGMMVTFSNVMFDTGKADIKPDMTKFLNKFIEDIENVPYKTLTVSGHTDTVGRRKLNMNLSKRRAQAVAQYLSKKGRINEKKIKTVGHGPDKPIATNETNAGRALNRRVEVVIDQAP